MGLLSVVYMTWLVSDSVKAGDVPAYFYDFGLTFGDTPFAALSIDTLSDAVSINLPFFCDNVQELRVSCLDLIVYNKVGLLWANMVKLVKFSRTLVVRYTIFDRSC